MSKNDGFYEILGKITYAFVSIDFLISNIATSLEIVNNPYEFFAIRSFEGKLKKVKAEIENKVENIELKSKLLTWIAELDELREKRNTVVHSIILKNVENDNEFRLFNYEKNGGKVDRKLHSFNFKDFEKINEELIAAHNLGVEIWFKLKSSQTF